MATAFKQHVDNAIAQIKNSGDLNNTTNPLTLDLATGKGALFALPGNGQYVTIWDKTSYPDPASDPSMEKATITARTGDSITLSRPNAQAHTGTPFISELPRSVHFSDIETAVNTAEGTLATAVSNIATNTTNIATNTADIVTANSNIALKQNKGFDAVIAASGGDYTTIGAALVAGKFRLRVMPGTYTETTNALNTYTDPGAGKEIYIEGVDKEACILQLWNNVAGGFDLKRRAVFSGMCIKPGSSAVPTLGSWIKCQWNTLFLDCIIFGNSSSGTATNFIQMSNAGEHSWTRMESCLFNPIHGGPYVVGCDYGKLAITTCYFNFTDNQTMSWKPLSIDINSCKEFIFVGNTTYGGKDHNSSAAIIGGNMGQSEDYRAVITGNTFKTLWNEAIAIPAVATGGAHITISNNHFHFYMTTARQSGSAVYIDNPTIPYYTVIEGNQFNNFSAGSNTFLMKLNNPKRSIITDNIYTGNNYAAALTGVSLVAPVDCIFANNFIGGFNGTTGVGLITTGTGSNTFFGNRYLNNTTNATLTIANTIDLASGVAAPATTGAGTITNHYGGDTNFLGDPTKWIAVTIDGVACKIPAY